MCIQSVASHPVVLSMLTNYPLSTKLTRALRPLLHPFFRQLQDGISEFTFANLYLFRSAHNYTVSLLPDQTTIVFLGRDKECSFFMLPFGEPEQSLLDMLFRDHGMMKCVSASQAAAFASRGYQVVEDRDNFDYLYRRQDLAELGGRAYHKKRNLIKAFVNSHSYEARPLRGEYHHDALRILDQWQEETGQAGDVAAAREAVTHMEELQLCGGIYYVAEQPVAFVLGEELAGGTMYAIHFEKAVSGYKGLYQFINQSFAAVLPEMYETINREQDLGDPGLRKAKLSYKPSGFVKKFKAYPAIPLPQENNRGDLADCNSLLA